MQYDLLKHNSDWVSPAWPLPVFAADHCLRKRRTSLPRGSHGKSLVWSKDGKRLLTGVNSNVLLLLEYPGDDRCVVDWMPLHAYRVDCEVVETLHLPTGEPVEICFGG